MTTPVFSPIPTWSPSTASVPQPIEFSSRWRSCIASAHRSARSAWSVVGSGAPKTAITASPWNLSIVPPCSEITSAIAPRCRPTISRDVARGETLRDRREPADVAEEDGDLQLALARGVPAARQRVHELRRHVRLERRRRGGLLDDGRMQPLELPEQARAAAILAGHPPEEHRHAPVDRLLGRAERGRHRLVPEALRHHVEDDPVLRRGFGASRQPFGDRGIDDAPALADLPDRADEFVPLRDPVLQQVGEAAVPLARATRSRTPRRRAPTAPRRRCRGAGRGSRARSRSPRVGTTAAS